MGPKFLISAPLIVTFLLNGKLGRRSTCEGKGKRKGSRMEGGVTKEQSILAQKFSRKQEKIYFLQIQSLESRLRIYCMEMAEGSG